MIPEYKNGNVIACCPDCGGRATTFEYKRNNSSEYGSLEQIYSNHRHGASTNYRYVYQLFRCAGCGRGGIGKIDCSDRPIAGSLLEFYPRSIEMAPLPNEVPAGILKEFREAEICAANGASRAALAMFRSTLEKIFKANGYTKGKLYEKIDAVAQDGIITATRKKRAHEELRELGNDILHDEWRYVSPEEVEKTHHYLQRIIEDFYDDRATVETALIEKKRILPSGETEELLEPNA